TNNRDRHVVDPYDLANYRRIAAEARSPVPRAQDRDGRRSWLIVFRNDSSAERRVDAKHTVVIAGGGERVRDLRLSVDDDADATEWGARKQIGHRAVVSDELPVHWIRERRAHVESGFILRREAVVARARDHVVLAAPFQANE